MSSACHMGNYYLLKFFINCSRRARMSYAYHRVCRGTCVCWKLYIYGKLLFTEETIISWSRRARMSSAYGKLCVTEEIITTLPGKFLLFTEATIITWSRKARMSWRRVSSFGHMSGQYVNPKYSSACEDIIIYRGNYYCPTYVSTVGEHEVRQPLRGLRVYGLWFMV